MSIEFHCLHCNRLLKTDDNKAGQRCECPNCKQLIVVPVPGGMTGAGESDEYSDQPYVYDSRRQKHYTIPQNACPQCFTPVNPGTTQCPTCGIALQGVIGGSSAHSINATHVFNRAIKTFREYWAISTGGAILFLFLWIGMRKLTGILLLNLPDLDTFIVIGGLMIQSLLLLGLHTLFLNIARRNDPQLQDLISGGRYIFRFIANQFVFFFLILIGTFCFVLPGILIALVYIPLGYVIVDQKLPGLLSIRRCFEITSGNKWKLCLLVLVAIGLLFWVIVALFLFLVVIGMISGGREDLIPGFVIAFPFINLLFAVAYCEMTGQ